MPDGDPFDPWATAVAEGGGEAPTKKIQAPKKDSWGGFEAGKAKPLSQEDATLPGKQGPGKKKRGGGAGGIRDQKGPTGPNLARVRVCEARSGGLVESWSNTFGWIRPFQKVNHPKAGKHGGKIYVHAKDVVGGFQVLPVGAPVEFYVFEDDAGLGAEEVNIGSDAPESKGAGTKGGKGDFGKWGGFGWGMGKFGGGFEKGMKGGKFGPFDWWGDKGSSGKDFSKVNKGDAGFKGSDKGEKGKSKGGRHDVRDKGDGRKGKGFSSAKGPEAAQKEAPQDWTSYTGLGASKSSSASACGSKLPQARGLGDSSFSSPGAVPGMGTAVSSSGLGLQCQAPCLQMGSMGMGSAPGPPGSMSGLGMNPLAGMPFPGMPFPPGSMGVSPGMNVGRPEFGSMSSGGINLGIFGNVQSGGGLGIPQNSGMFGGTDATAQPWTTYNSL